MKRLTDLCIGNISLSWNSLFKFSLLLILLFTSCTSRPKPYSILEFSGKGEFYNYSRSIIPILFETDSASSTALLAGNGDLIAYGSYSFFLYSDSSQKKISVKTINNNGYINDKINSINIPADDEMIPWFRQMKSTDISQLGFLYFDSIINEGYLPYLNDLAETRQDMGLGYEGDLKDMNRIFEIFNPKFIIGPEIPQKDFNLLSGLSNLRFLYASLNDSVYTIPLPAMPKLNQLILAGIETDAIKTDDFLINNKQIERLTIIESENFNFSVIKPLSNLRELIINGSDTIINFELISDHKHLELLSFSEKSSYEMVMRELPDIRWMTFHSEATQDLFNSFVSFHPDLEVVEIMNNDRIINLSQLSSLKKLFGLTITDTLTDFSTLKSLNSLKYLSLPDHVLNDSTKRDELQKSLPATRIVANYGVCMGSGWLLLIIPIILVFKVFARQKSRKT
jgi:hypothetical protein